MTHSAQEYVFVIAVTLSLLSWQPPSGVNGQTSETLTTERPVADVTNIDVSSVPTDVWCDFPLVDAQVSVSVQGQEKLEGHTGNFTVGSEMSISCRNASWTLAGPSHMTCIDPGVWSSDEATSCSYVACDVPSAPSNGSVRMSRDDPLPGTWVLFSCDDGFTLVGHDNQTCDVTGTWSTLAPNCSRMTCAPPADVPYGNYTPSPPSSPTGRYDYGTTLTYHCQEGYRVEVKKFTLTCIGEDTWDSVPPSCLKVMEDTPGGGQRNNTTPEAPSTGSDVTTPWEPEEKPCGSPDPLPNGQYHVYAKSVLYKCDYGYDLVGEPQRACRTNGSWTGTAPSCVAVTSPFLWKQMFTDHKEWLGVYNYRGQKVKFKFWVLEVNDQTGGTVEGLFLDEHKAKLHLSGLHTSAGIVLQTSRLLHPTESFRDLSWQVTGHLARTGAGWQYSGTALAATEGFGPLTMTPASVVEAPPTLPHDSAEANITALALGITIALVAIAIAATLAAYCVKRRLGVKASGHRTLTSFENPVYEYENNSLK